MCTQMLSYLKIIEGSQSIPKSRLQIVCCIVLVSGAINAVFQETSMEGRRRGEILLSVVVDVVKQEVGTGHARDDMQLTNH